MAASKAGQQVHGWFAFKLNQRRFRNGRVYISGIMEGGNKEALDVRFFVEAATYVQPTRLGFRIPWPSTDTFLRISNSSLDTSMSNLVVYSIGQRSLLVNYRDDRYGKGVDVRYFVDSPSFKGWDLRGIRFKIEDWKTFSAELNRLMGGGSAGALDNLFAERPIRSFSGPNAPTSTRGGRGGSPNEIHSSITHLLEEL